LQQKVYEITGQWVHVGTRYFRGSGDLKAFFEGYIEAVALCLASPNPEYHGEVVYYTALSDVAECFSRARPTDDTRQRAVRGLDEIVQRFQSYYADVVEEYLKLRRYCSGMTTTA
jgi:hypothetical protein